MIAQLEIARMIANAIKPPCEVCGKSYSEHNMGHGVPMCPIYPTYRPRKDAA